MLEGSCESPEAPFPRRLADPGLAPLATRSPIRHGSEQVLVCPFWARPQPGPAANGRRGGGPLGLMVQLQNGRLAAVERTRASEQVAWRGRDDSEAVHLPVARHPRFCRRYGWTWAWGEGGTWADGAAAGPVGKESKGSIHAGAIEAEGAQKRHYQRAIAADIAELSRESEGASAGSQTGACIYPSRLTTGYLSPAQVGNVCVMVAVLMMRARARARFAAPLAVSFLDSTVSSAPSVPLAPSRRALQLDRPTAPVPRSRSGQRRPAASKPHRAARRRPGDP